MLHYHNQHLNIPEEERVHQFHICIYACILYTYICILYIYACMHICICYYVESVTNQFSAKMCRRFILSIKISQISNWHKMPSK